MTFLSVKDVANLFQCSECTVRNNAKKGSYPFRSIRIGSLYKFPKEEVLSYLYGKDYKPEAGNENGTDD